MKTMMKKAALTLAAVMLLVGGAFAQQVIKGQIIDKETGEPVIGATIMNKATRQGTVTDKLGEFSIKTKEAKTVLAISYLGYKPQEILVNDPSQPLLLSLDQAVSALQDVVVIGYARSTRGQLTGSVTTVTGEDLEKAATSSLLEALQGRVAGMLLTQSSGLPGDETDIAIRGKNSMNMKVGACCSARPLTKTTPLILIDGVPFSSDSMSALGLGSIGDIDPLSSLNPADVERIEVLKDADATAIYGTRGANGVILITTKKGV